MLDIDPSLHTWGWIFLLVYIGAMLSFGYIGMRRVRSSDDFATARGGYGPLFLAFALTATAASGGTFIGLPAIAYKSGFSALWYAFVYPLGLYAGMLICLRGIRRAGANFGSRSMPEYLGDRFDSEALRICVALFSMLLMFYLAAQLLAGAVMFNKMMGIELLPALMVTALIIMVYIVIGGAHADILTDGVQGALMLILAVAVTVMFFVGFGVDGGFNGMVQNLEAQDPLLTKTLNPTSPILDSWWDVVAIFVMHAPLGLLPHVANKVWALKHDRDQVRFIAISFVFGMTLPAIAFGGILARAVLGDALLLDDASANDAIPALFIATLPAWLAAMIGAGVLAAIMSTADGLVVSTSQVFANDIYRRTIAPRLKAKPDDKSIDRISLIISRAGAVLIVAGSIWLAWVSRSMNVALLIAAGVGGMIAAISGPIFTGIMWRRTSKAGALSGFAAGGASFLVLKAGFLQAEWFSGSVFEIPGTWLATQASNPFACATLAVFASIFFVVIVSLFTQPPNDEHLRRVFGN